MPLKACAYRKKGMMLLPRAELHAVQFVRGVCGTNTRAYLVQVSGQRGNLPSRETCKGWLAPVTAP